MSFNLIIKFHEAVKFRIYFSDLQTITIDSDPQGIPDFIAQVAQKFRRNCHSRCASRLSKLGFKWIQVFFKQLINTP